MIDFWKKEGETKFNKKKICTVIAIVIILIAITVISIIYIYNDDVRDWTDKNIFRKEVLKDNAITIDTKDTADSNIYAFNKYIGVLNKNNMSIYSNTGNKDKELEIQISNPIFDSSNRFLAIGEEKGRKLYLLEDKEIAWKTEIEGNIAQIHVNRNGYVAVVIVDTSYKTVIDMYNPKGERLFKTFLSSTRIADISISNDNKFLAIAEIDTSGIKVQSNIKILSIEDASKKATDIIKKTYNGEKDKLIVNINYQDKNDLVCMYTDSIHIIQNEQDNVLIDNTNKKVMFQTINLENNIASIEEKSTGLFTADTAVSIINTDSKMTKEYNTKSVTKEIYAYKNIIALNLGTEIEFINTDGWLVKRYKANQEITNIAVSNNIACIIYRDKIEIINL